MRSIRHYDNSFKVDALKYIDSHPNLKLYEVAANLGIPKETLYEWTKTANRAKILGEELPTESIDIDEIRRLQRENRDLKDALEILKKAISILND